MDFPRTMIEFERRFATEADCIEFLRAQRWQKGFRCPRCDGGRAWQLRTRPLDQCVACGHQVSLTAGTVFQGTRKPLVLWFRVIARFLTSKSGCSALEIARLHGLNYETAWTWLHKIRWLMDRSRGRPLSGAVEADESIVGGRKSGFHGRQLGTQKIAVLAAVECRGKGSGRLRLSPSASMSTVAINSFITRNIEPGTVVATDAFPGYRQLGDLGYGHQPTVLTVGNLYASEQNGSKHFPRIHRVFSLLKRMLLGTYHGGISRKHFCAYLDEFVFRFNRRTSRSPLLLACRILESSFTPVPIRDALFARKPQWLVAA